jgi:hypothetical protein
MVRVFSMAADVSLKSDLSYARYLIDQHVRSPHNGLRACIEVLEELGAHRFKSTSRIAQLLTNEMDCMS